MAISNLMACFRILGAALRATRRPPTNDLGYLNPLPRVLRDDQRRADQHTEAVGGTSSK